MNTVEYPGRNPIAPITGSATPEMTSPDFWKLDDTILMTQEEIDEYNRYIENENGLGVVDLLTAPHTVTREELIDMITSGQTLEDTVFLADERVTPMDLHELEEIWPHVKPSKVYLRGI